MSSNGMETQLCVCVFVPAAPQAGRGSAAGGSDWSSPAVQLAAVG